MTSTEYLDEMRERLRAFVNDREWSEFHNPKNLAMALASEAGELLSTLRWVRGEASDEFVVHPANRLSVEEEVADVAITLLLFCDRAGIDLLAAIERKINLNEVNYPVESARGRSERPRAEN
jgi:NTP pyrophosphatase (non-canonical NTP hydrolase)